MSEKNNTASDQGISSENRLLKIFILGSVAIHVLIFFLKLDEFFPVAKPIIDEMVIEADMMPDFDIKPAKEDALPDAAKAEEVMVHKQILPQLPKTFEVEKKVEEPEDAIAIDEKPKEKEKEEPKKEPEKPKNEPKKDAMAAEERETAVKLKKREAFERLMKEAARKEEKFAEQTSAPLSKKLAQRKAELDDQEEGGFSGDGGLSGIRQKKYMRALRKAIKRNYSLPSAYNLQNAEIVAKVSLILNGNGDIREVKIYESSGDKVYDYLALKAVKDSVPLPKPPEGQAGKQIIIQFNPKTF